MDAELAKIIRGLEQESYNRGRDIGYAHGVLEVFKALDDGKDRADIIKHLLEEFPHSHIRVVIEEDNSGHYLIEEIEGELCDVN